MVQILHWIFFIHTACIVVCILSPHVEKRLGKISRKNSA